MNRLLLGIVFVALMTGAACADALGVTAVDYTSIAGHSNYDLIGYQFTTANAIDITELGLAVLPFGNPFGSATVESHFVGIYQSGSPLVDLTVAGGSPGNATIPGSPAPLSFAMDALAQPFELAAGTYFIGAYYNAGSPDYIVDSGGGGGVVTMNTGLTFNEDFVYYSGGPFNPAGPLPGSTFTTGNPSRAAYFGPNFEYVPAAPAVPEPGTLMLLASGLLATIRVSRRKR